MLRVELAYRRGEFTLSAKAEIGEGVTALVGHRVLGEGRVGQARRRLEGNARAVLVAHAASPPGCPANANGPSTTKAPPW